MRPIHVNGVEESVLDAHYFDKIIDFSHLSIYGEYERGRFFRARLGRAAIQRLAN